MKIILSLIAAVTVCSSANAQTSVDFEREIPIVSDRCAAITDPAFPYTQLIFAMREGLITAAEFEEFVEQRIYPIIGRDRIVAFCPF